MGVGLFTFIRNITGKKTHQDWVKINPPHTKPENIPFDNFGSLFLSCTPDQHFVVVIKPSNEHPYQVCFQLAQWFQRRRFKTDSTYLTLLAYCCFCVHPINNKYILLKTTIH
jgi:hypothetical protein